MKKGMLKSIIYSLAISLFSYSCNSEIICSEISNHINGNFNEDASDIVIDLRDVYDFQWDVLYVFGAFDHPNDISRAIGFDCECQMVPDNKEMFLFIWNNRIVKKEVTDCESIQFEENSNRKDAFKIDYNNSKFRIKKISNASNKYLLRSIPK